MREHETADNDDLLEALTEISEKLSHANKKLDTVTLTCALLWVCFALSFVWTIIAAVS